MIQITHKELQELINSEVTKAVKEYQSVTSSCGNLLSKVETKIQSMEKEIEKKDLIINELVEGMKKIILTKEVARALQIPGDIIWSVSSTSMINIAKRTLKKLEIE